MEADELRHAAVSLLCCISEQPDDTGSGRPWCSPMEVA